MHAQSQDHCPLTAWKLHRAARITTLIKRATAELNAVLDMQKGQGPQPAMLVAKATAESDSEPEAEPEQESHWLVARVQGVAYTAGEYLAHSASGGVVATAHAAKNTAVTTYYHVKPSVVSAAKYATSPSGCLNLGATACAFASLQFATVATVSSTASVSANGLAAVLQTSAEIASATGDTGAIRRALRDPSYAKDLQEILNQRREAKQRRRVLDTVQVWASLVNDNAVARVSPFASRLVAGTGARVARLFWGRREEVSVDGDADPSVEEHAAMGGKRSYLLESTRLALFVNSWVSTTLHSKVHELRDTPEHSVEFLVSVAGRVSEYRQAGWYEGSQAAYGDMINPALSAAASTGLTLGKHACGSAWQLVRHPFSTLGLWKARPECECQTKAVQTDISAFIKQFAD